MSEWSCGWPAPAKLNLMLRVVGRRTDGYHELQTVFQFLQTSDTLDFRLRADGQIKRASDVPGVSEDDDLIIRAARQLQAQVGESRGVDIRIDKKLPMGAGLGGGSSDAATVLVALNCLWGCGLNSHELAELGLSLGADVPIFVGGQAAWAEGVGECLEPIELPEPWFLVLVPGCHVSTAAVFQDPDLTRDSPRITIRAFAAGDTLNDCLPVVRKRYPEVAQALDWLAKFADARLTGTGACVFAGFDTQAAAERTLAQLPTGMQGFVARGMNRSSLLGRLAEESRAQ
jgi:4-diphosphocytidyl-2-C-methyl-D-erythritol kinase